MDLQKFGQGLASNFTQQQFGRNQSILQMLGQFSGATTGSMAGAAGAIQNGNNTANGQLNSGLGNIMSGLGGLSRSGSTPYTGGPDPYAVDGW